MRTKLGFVFCIQTTKTPDDLFDHSQVETSKGPFKIMNSYKLQ